MNWKYLWIKRLIEARGKARAKARWWKKEAERKQRRIEDLELALNHIADTGIPLEVCRKCYNTSLFASTVL